MSEETTLEEHISPDGLLSLTVSKDNSADIMIRFAGFQWHTHADIQAELLGTSQAEAVRKFVDAIINDRMVIVLSSMNSKLTNAFPSDDPTYELESFKKYAATGESMELRYWSGKAYR